MKLISLFRHLALVAVVSVFLTGCLLKPITVSTRHYILTPIPRNEAPSAEVEHLSVGVRFARMPSYLLRNSMVIRNGDNEIEYVEDALWAERLDRCFQRTLSDNLSTLLSSDSIYTTDWGPNQVMLKVFINVQQFDVDTLGHGTLIAQWRITTPGDGTPFKSQHVNLTRTAACPRANPAVIAATLSDLEAEFSRKLAQSLRESVKTSQ